MRFSGFVIAAVALAFFSVTVLADEPVVVTEDDLRGMSLKQLKSFLKDRGLSCDACAEKRNFFELALENIDVPVKETMAPKVEAQKMETPAPAKEGAEEGEASNVKGEASNVKGDASGEIDLDNLPDSLDEEGQIDMLMKMLESAGEAGKYSREDIKRMFAEGPGDMAAETPTQESYAEELDKIEVQEEDLTGEASDDRKAEGKKDEL